jgi:hypothetical protein
MTYSFHPRAEQELDKAVRYYEECSSGLGLEFAEEVYAAIARIIAYANDSGRDRKVQKIDHPSKE